MLSINRKGWDKVAPRFFGGTALPEYGPLSEKETELGLIDNLTDKAVLELGCGSGHSLFYLWREKQAKELWYAVSRAKLMSTTFIIKASKPS